MQSLLLSKGNEAHEWVAPVNFHGEQDAESAQNNNQEGSLIIKEGEGVYYVRYNIIFAKAGDVFFMPRVVPKDFSLDTDKVIPFTASAGDFEKFYNENFLPVKREEVKRFAKLSASIQ